MNKTLIKDCCVIVALIIVLVLRIFCDLDGNVISSINTIGMFISLISTTIMLTVNLKRRYIAYGVLIFVIELVCAVAATIVVLLNLIEISSRIDDINTILALLFSLPIEFYKKIEIALGITKCQN